MQGLSKFLRTPLLIGNKTIKRRLVLAPLSGLSHVAFRELLSQYKGYGLLFTGMASAKAIPKENSKVSTVFSWRKSELSHLVCQIFGSDPKIMAQAAVRIEQEGFFGVDINCGCSASAICKYGAGAALLKKPRLAASIIKAVRKAVKFPVFIKYRTGWEDDPKHAVFMARLFCDEGADALTFHPRVAPDLRTRPPKWEYIAKVKDASKVPVFGNGNVFSASDCKKMLSLTNCDAVAIGRIALARPWIMAKWADKKDLGPDAYLDACLAMTRLCSRHFEPRTAFLRFKKFAAYFCANFKFGHAFNKQINAAHDMDHVVNIIEGFFASPPDLNKRPNPNLFI